MLKVPPYMYLSQTQATQIRVFGCRTSTRHVLSWLTSFRPTCFDPIRSFRLAGRTESKRRLPTRRLCAEETFDPSEAATQRDRSLVLSNLTPLQNHRAVRFRRDIRSFDVDVAPAFHGDGGATSLEDNGIFGIERYGGGVDRAGGGDCFGQASANIDALLRAD